VFDLMLAQYGVGRDGLPGEWPSGYADSSAPYTPAWHEEITSVPADACTRIAREFATNAEESGGRSMIIMARESANGSTATRPTARSSRCCC
jgi:nitrate reductase alpha subunit